MFNVVDGVLQKVKLNEYINFIKFLIHLEFLRTLKTLWDSWPSKWRVEAMGDDGSSRKVREEMHVYCVCCVLRVYVRVCIYTCL